MRDNPVNFQISAPVQPGNSGGPLLDSEGNVIGVVVSKLNAARIAEMTGGDIPQNVNFAVKGTEALAFLRENGVQPRTAASTGGRKSAPAEIDEIANPSTVYVQCYQADAAAALTRPVAARRRRRCPGRVPARVRARPTGAAASAAAAGLAAAALGADPAASGARWPPGWCCCGSPATCRGRRRRWTPPAGRA